MSAHSAFNRHPELRLGAEHLMRLRSARVVAELLAEIGDRAGCEQVILETLGEYRRLSRAMVKVTGADRFPPHFRGAI